MEIVYLSGAYKNAGDFLIEKRAVELLEYAIPGVNITRILRSDIAGKIGEINERDAVVIGGGPIYQENLDGYMPLQAYIDKVKRPTMIMGGGWYGPDGGASTVFRYRFEELTKRFLQKIYESGFGFSCRDIHTVNVLRNAGFKDSVMTGCPAWYDLEFAGKADLRDGDGPIRKIVVSDPAKLCNLEGALGVVRYLRDRYPRAEMTVVFHRGITNDKYTSGKSGNMLFRYAGLFEDLGAKVLDISYSADGFRVYDDCDLHVGFRVHAHIYNLSRRNRTILIEEDGRGAGVNETLGLPSIRAYDDRVLVKNVYLRKIHTRMPYYANRHIADELGSYLDLLEATGCQYLKNAFALQNIYFDRMTDFVRQLGQG